MAKTDKAEFIEPMLLLRTERLPEGPEWLYELKLDGYRAIAAKSLGKVGLWSRNAKDFGAKYPHIAAALEKLPNNTVVDGEIVAFDEAGKPSFTALQNYGSAQRPLTFYIFDVLRLAGRDLQSEPLDVRRKLLAEKLMPLPHEPIRPSPELPGSLDQLIKSVRAQGLEGLVAKRRDSRYEAGARLVAGSYGREDERMPLAKAGIGWAV